MASNISSNISVKYFLPPFTQITIRVIESREVSLKVDEGSAKFMFYDGDPSEAVLSAGDSRLLWPETISLQCDAASILTTTGLPAEISAIETTKKLIEIRKLFKGIFEDESCRFILENDIKLRISVGGEDSLVKFKAINGTPEILGATIELGKEYVFPQYSTTLINTFTERQYTIGIEGKNHVINVLARYTEKPLEFMQLVENLNSHRAKAREAEAANSERKQTGPNILVLGPPNSGKTSLSHFLVNRAVGSGERPLFIDLEVRRNTNSRICGILSFVRVREQYLLRGDMEGITKLFFFGSTNPYDNLSLYLQQIKQIGSQVMDLLFESDKEKTRHSGVIVDICGLVSEDSQVITCILESMRIKQVFVISDSGRQYHDRLAHLFEFVDVQLIEKAMCIEERDEAKEITRRDNDLRKYFQDTPESPIIMVDVDYDNAQIYSTVFQTNTEAAAYSLINNIEGIPFIKVAISTHQVNSVLAVVKRGVGRPDDLVKVVKYFVLLEGYDNEKKIYRFLSPVIEQEDWTKRHILTMGTIKMDLMLT